MLVEHTTESAARLPQDFSRMDIKDLLKPSPSPPPTRHRRPSSSVQGTSPPPHKPLRQHLPPPDSLLPSTSSGFPVLPSPAPTVSYLTHEYYDHRNSPPRYIKSEYQDSSRHSWVQRTQHAGLYHDYQGYPHGPQYRDHSLSAFPSPGKRPLRMEDQDSKRPRKKGPNQKWDAEEDARIIELRGSGMKWADISKHLPGRSDIGCRLHYQNYLEKRGEWDEEKKTRLARVYERLKADLWQPIATELNVPWRAAEAMHWILGEREIARRANTTPFSIVSGANSAGPQGEGNGRIAQSNRMHDSTIYFEANDVNAVLNGPEGTNGPVSVFGQSLQVTGRGDDHVPSNFRAHQSYNGNDDGSTDEMRCSRRRASQERLAAGERDMTLPSLADLDDGISAFAGCGGHAAYGSPPEEIDRRTSHASYTYHPNRRDHRDNAVSRASQSSPSKSRKSNGSRSSQAGSDGRRDSGSSGSGGYVQVTRKRSG